MHYTDEIVAELRSHFPSLSMLHVYDGDRVKQRYESVVEAFPTTEVAFRSAVPGVCDFAVLLWVNTKAVYDFVRKGVGCCS